MTAPHPTGPSARPADLPRLAVRTLLPGDTAALRALAHPARLALLGALRTDGPAPVGALAATLGIAPGSASYHLATLAAHGFVEETSERPPGMRADNRSRWWRATDRTTAWEPAHFDTTPEGAAAVHDLEASILTLLHQRALAALDRRPSLEPRWQPVHFFADDRIALTAAEGVELRAELETLVGRWSERAADPSRTTDPTLPVAVVVQTFPEPTATPAPADGTR